MNSIQLKEYLDLQEFTKPVTSIQENLQNMLLVGGDFSGIQKYIYKIVSKQAGRSLKGRSFYLHLLSDSIVRFLLKQLNSQKDAVVYNSGGSFYLVVRLLNLLAHEDVFPVAQVEHRGERTPAVAVEHRVVFAPAYQIPHAGVLER